MGRNIGKTISKDLSSKYIPQLPDHAKQSDADQIKATSKRTIAKTAGATGVSKTSLLIE